MKSYDRAVYIGRFQPCHMAHVSTIKHALSIANKVLILIGSANVAPNIRNPWSFEERRDMILENLTANERACVDLKPISDHLYNDNVWSKGVYEAVAPAEGERVALVGASKDESTYYLDILPFLERVESPVTPGVDSTAVRELIYSAANSGYVPPTESLTHIVTSNGRSTFLSHGSAAYINDWCKRNWDEAQRLGREHSFIQKYKHAWAMVPYPPTFVTTDAVVMCCGHVLVVRRKAAPGEGLIALPGGFIGQHERLLDGCIRELREETKLKVPAPVLRGCLKGKEVFDNPRRSLRGRTITHAFYFELKDSTLPKVKGGDDAASAEWMPLATFVTKQKEIYEDHASIVAFFTGVQL